MGFRFEWLVILLLEQHPPTPLPLHNPPPAYDTNPHPHNTHQFVQAPPTQLVQPGPVIVNQPGYARQVVVRTDVILTVIHFTMLPVCSTSTCT